MMKKCEATGQCTHRLMVLFLCLMLPRITFAGTERPLFGELDNRIVVAINSWHSPFMDVAILVITDFWFFVLVVCCIIAHSIRQDKHFKTILFCAMLIVAVGCTDYLCAGVIRPAVQQLRPTNPDNPVHAMLHIVHGYVGGKYGFPSCHAANSFAIGIFTSLWFRKRLIAAILTSWALLECYTRLYLGVHYLSDIVFGIAIGSMIAYIVYYLLKRRCGERHG